MSLSRDRGILTATRGIRGFVDGAVSVVLTAYLAALGFSGRAIGVIVTAMMLGSALVTLLVGVGGHLVRRRTILLAGAVLMTATGVAFSATTAFAGLLLIGILGTINPTSGDISVFLPMEQSLLTVTVGPERRTTMFARYAFVGSIAAAVGSLAAGLPEWVADRTDIAEVDALRMVFAVYAVAGVASLLLYRLLSPAVEPRGEQAASRLGKSRSMVYRLAALFGLDAFAGGFTVQSLIALWLFRRFDLSVATAGALLFWTGVCTACSAFAAPRLARRFGLIRTMVFSHIPAQLFLIGAALSPNLSICVVFLVLRSLLSAMDVPARNSYVMAVVSPPERAAAASITNVPRSLASALPPLAAGWMLDHSTFGWPLLIAGVLKIVYDLSLLVMFRNVRPPEERSAMA